VTPDTGGTPLLAVRNLEVVYGSSIRVLRGVSLDVPVGEVVALLGANGAGKTTLLRAVSGLLAGQNGRIVRGTIELDGSSITAMATPNIVRLGLAQVMEGRRIFAELTVDENLRAGAFTRRDRANVKDTYQHVLDMFPVLATRHRDVAGYLSGGEQQMLAIGRALMARPKLILLDEPSLGLAPRVVEEIFTSVQRLNTEAGTTVLLVEQNARRALDIAHHAYVMERGRIVLEGAAAELAQNLDVREFYLGVGEGGARKSYRDVKHYKRRKRWL
jgi:branched-chain amino acid transport system ATP-binding protein